MNRTFSERKPKKVDAKNKENETIIRALHMYGKVPEQWELLNEIERLNDKIHDISETLNETYNDRTELRNENKRLNNIINELEKYVKERINFYKQEIKEFQDDLFTSNYEEIEDAKNEIKIRRCHIIELEDTLDKIEELKGSDSND